jgi:hypothetical protein
MIWTPGITTNSPNDDLSEGTKTQLTALYYTIWVATTDTTSQVAERLATFRWNNFRFRSRPHMVLSEGLAFWSSYLARLYITRARYLKACQNYEQVVAAVEEHHTANNTDEVPIEFVAAQFAYEDHIRLELETFYVMSQLLLERIATTFTFFFACRTQGWRKGSKHHRLTETFNTLSASISRGNAPPERLHFLMKELVRRIVSFRNIHIEHPSSPLAGTRHWPSRESSRDGTTYLSVEAYSADSVPLIKTENPSELILLIEEYIDRLLTYFDTYRAASIFGSQDNQ